MSLPKVVLFIMAIISFAVLAVAYLPPTPSEQRSLDCRESPSRALGLKGSFVVASSSSALWFCGTHERAALPTVVRCYAMDGCSE